MGTLEAKGAHLEGRLLDHQGLWRNSCPEGRGRHPPSPSPEPWESELMLPKLPSPWFPPLQLGPGSQLSDPGREEGARRPGGLRGQVHPGRQPRGSGRRMAPPALPGSRPAGSRGGVVVSSGPGGFAQSSASRTGRRQGPADSLQLDGAAGERVAPHTALLRVKAAHTTVVIPHGNHRQGVTAVTWPPGAGKGQ